MQTIFSVPNSQDLYDCFPGEQATNQTKLIKWVLLSKTCPDIESNIKNLLVTNPDTINESDSKGYTALMIACGNLVSINIIKLLTDSDANIILQSATGKTALMIATIHGYYEACEVVRGGCDIRDECGYTPLSLAVTGNHEKICKLLIQAGCNVNIPTLIGNTPLMLTAITRNETLCSILITSGADLTAKNNEGKTAYDLSTDSLQQLLKPKTKTLRIKYGDILIEREIDFDLDNKQLEKIMEILVTYAK